MENPKNINKEVSISNKSKNILELEKEIVLGLWIQVIGQFIELKGLSGLFYIEEDGDKTGEQQVLAGAWIKTIGQILEAISVSSQIRETDIIQLLQEQRLAVTGELLVTLGSAFEVIGGTQILEEESRGTLRFVP